MDERFRGKGGWIALAVIGFVVLCLMVWGGAVMAMFLARPGPVAVQPPASIEGAVPAVPYYGHGFFGGGLLGIVGFGFKLLFFGLLLLLGLGLVRRLFWGHRYGCMPPGGKAWQGKDRAHWGPWGWHGHPMHGKPEGRAEGDEGEEPEYTGPQE
jgi:hypothetical protein